MTRRPSARRSVKKGEMTMTEDTAKNENRTERVPSVNNTDVIAIIACWAGAAAVTYFSKEPVVAVIAIGAAYYLAKWIILKKESQ
jgi:hypothetical protein